MIVTLTYSDPNDDDRLFRIAVNTTPEGLEDFLDVNDVIFDNRER